MQENVCIGVGSFGKCVLCVLNNRVEVFLCINVCNLQRLGQLHEVPVNWIKEEVM